MELGLKSRVALITGASKGIGKATAIEFAKERANLAICARGKELLEETEASLAELGASVVAGTVDVASQGEVEAFVAKTVEAFGRIDILVNNAGNITSGNFFDLSNEHWLQQFNVSVLGMVNFCRVVIPQMQQQKWGRIINLGTGLAMEPSLPMPFGYNSAKAVVGLMSKSLSSTFARDNITVNCVSPGAINTTLQTDPGGFMDQIGAFFGMTGEQAMEYTRTNIPLGRWGTADDVVAAIVFLASEKASYITGVNLIVDGGLRKSWM